MSCMTGAVALVCISIGLIFIAGIAAFTFPQVEVFFLINWRTSGILTVLV